MSSVTKYRKMLHRFVRAVKTARTDLNSPITIYVSYDHSLCSSWLVADSPSRTYDHVGLQIFELYSRFGTETPYRFVISWSAFHELQNLLAIRSDVMEGIANDIPKLRRAHRLISASESAERLLETSRRATNNAMNPVHMQKFVAMLSHEHIPGTLDIYPTADVTRISEPQVFNRMMKIVTEIKQIPDTVAVDVIFARDMNIVQNLEVIYIHEHIQDEKTNFVYSGDPITTKVYSPNIDKYTKDPLSILVSLYAFSQNSGNLPIVIEAHKFFNNFEEDCSELSGRLKGYSENNKELTQLTSIDRNKVNEFQRLYLIGMYGLDLNGNYKQEDLFENSIELDELGLIRDFAENSAVRTRKNARKMNRILESFSDATDIYNPIKQQISSESQKRMSEIIRKLSK